MEVFYRQHLKPEQQEFPTTVGQAIKEMLAEGRA